MWVVCSDNEDDEDDDVRSDEEHTSQAGVPGTPKTLSIRN
jgi:hypothetical protein